MDDGAPAAQGTNRVQKSSAGLQVGLSIRAQAQAQRPSRTIDDADDDLDDTRDAWITVTAWGILLCID